MIKYNAAIVNSDFFKKGKILTKEMSGKKKIQIIYIFK